MIVPIMKERNLILMAKEALRLGKIIPCIAFKLCDLRPIVHASVI